MVFIVLLRLSTNRGAAREHVTAHREWLQRGIDDGVFLLAGTLQPAAGGVVVAHNTSLEELEARVNADPFVIEDVVRPEILEVAPTQAADPLGRLLT